MRINRVLGFFGGAIFCLVFAVSALAQTRDSDEISGLLSQARTQAWQAAQDADTLQSYTMSPMTWESHATQLRLIQDRVNVLAKTTQQLNDLRSQGSQWQQTAIDRINPLLRDMDEALATNDYGLQRSPRPGEHTDL